MVSEVGSSVPVDLNRSGALNMSTRRELCIALGTPRRDIRRVLIGVPSVPTPYLAASMNDESKPIQLTVFLEIVRISVGGCLLVSITAP